MAFAMIPNLNKPGEMKPLVLSPSNMGVYLQCPRKFQGQSVTGEIQWRASRQKSRGQLVHAEVQKALKHGLQAVSSWTEGTNVYFIQEQVRKVRQQIADGATLFIEHELTINSALRPAPGGWWDETAFLRARADATILPLMSEGNEISWHNLEPHVPAELIDIKTGRIYDTEDFQLRVEALLIHLIYGRPVVNYSYWYVDSGEPVDGTIDFRNGLAPVKDIMDCIKNMKLAFENNDFPPVKNKFCSWCDLNNKPACGV